MTNDRPAKDLSLAAGTHIYNDTHDTTDFNRLCSFNIQRSLKKFGFTLTLLFTSYAVMFFGPYYRLVEHGERTTTSSLKIPFVEPFSDLEFLINMPIQLLMFLMGCPGNIGVEGFFAILMDSTAASTEYIQWECMKLSEKHRIGQPRLTNTKMELIKILTMIQSTDGYFQNAHYKNYDEFSMIFNVISKLCRWLRDASNLFYWHHFLSPIAFTYTIGLSIYCQFKVRIIIMGII